MSDVVETHHEEHIEPTDGGGVEHVVETITTPAADVVAGAEGDILDALNRIESGLRLHGERLDAHNEALNRAVEHLANASNALTSTAAAVAEGVTQAGAESADTVLEVAPAVATEVDNAGQTVTQTVEPTVKRRRGAFKRR